MRHVDRLSALMARFALEARPAAPGEGVLHLLGAGGVPERLLLQNDGRVPAGAALMSAHLEWGGAANPLLSALPARIERPVGAEDAALATVFLQEATAKRCGSGPVLNRIAEVLVIRLLRGAIEQGAAETGLLAGLADPRLARAIVAMHEAPGQAWSNADLAREAGLSVSRFAELFQRAMGETPMAYLRRWRLALAHRDLRTGARVQTVARRYGYGSPEALSRAYRRHHGAAPREARG